MRAVRYCVLLDYRVKPDNDIFVIARFTILVIARLTMLVIARLTMLVIARLDRAIYLLKIQTLVQNNSCDD